MPRSKAHFLILDGLRGVAAIAIVVFHFMEWIYGPAENFIGHGFLAVDFFFCLSGFVIGYAYDDRLHGMGVKQFFISRLIRLHPMVVFGACLGLIAFVFDPFATCQDGYSVGRILLLFIGTELMVPLPVMPDRFFNLFGLNPPTWSLFWEYVANIAYAFVLVKIPRRFLFFLLVPAAVGLFCLSYTKGNLLGGWAGDNFGDGGIRIAYSFTAGLIIYRYGWIIKNRIGFYGLSLLLALAFISPHLSNHDVLEACIVIFYFPLLISLGAGSSLDPKSVSLCKLSGGISYPLYMTHYAFLSIFGSYFLAYKPGTGTLTVVIIAGTFVTIFFAWVVMKFFDTPVRKYLTGLRQKKAV
ncbi:MAG: acyltransferase [Chitinophagaceae bacterium]|nr:acyltransferase [Chitinophagaceae bacterium]